MRKKLLFACLLTIFLTSFSFAQQISVTGRVSDEKGNAISGATVTVKGSNQATVTNENGTFTINVKKGTPLIISNVGFGSKTVVASGDPINVSL